MHISSQFFDIILYEETWEHTSVHWQLGKVQYEWIASRVGAQFRTWASEIQRHVPPLSVVSHVLTTRPWPTRQNGLAPAERYHTLDTTASCFSAESFSIAIRIICFNDITQWVLVSFQT